MIFLQALLSIGWIAIALRTERSAPFLRTAWICFAFASAALALVRISAFHAPGPLHTADFVATVLFIALAFIAYIFSLVRKEPQRARRWLWDRSYAE